MLIILFLLALPESVNFAMILANRAVPLFKIKEFKLAIDDLHASIQTGKYPTENVHKLYQRLATAHEHLQEYQKAIEMYRKQFDSMRSSSLLKSQKLQMKSDIEKSMARCKRCSGAQNFTTYQSDYPDSSSAEFPVYPKLHSQLPNASGMFIRWSKHDLNIIDLSKIYPYENVALGILLICFFQMQFKSCILRREVDLSLHRVMSKWVSACSTKTQSSI